MMVISSLPHQASSHSAKDNNTISYCSSLVSRHEMRLTITTATRSPYFFCATRKNTSAKDRQLIVFTSLHGSRSSTMSSNFCTVRLDPTLVPHLLAIWNVVWANNTYRSTPCTATKTPDVLEVLNISRFTLWIRNSLYWNAKICLRLPLYAQNQTLPQLSKMLSRHRNFATIFDKTRRWTSSRACEGIANSFVARCGQYYVETFFFYWLYRSRKWISECFPLFNVTVLSEMAGIRTLDEYLIAVPNSGRNPQCLWIDL